MRQEVQVQEYCRGCRVYGGLPTGRGEWAGWRRLPLPRVVVGSWLCGLPPVGRRTTTSPISRVYAHVPFGYCHEE